MTRTSWHLLWTSMALVLMSPRARAETVGVTAEVRDVPPRNYANLRLGGSTSSRHATVCLEVSPLEWVGLEACGNGSGFLHDDDAPEVAHFRTNMGLALWKADALWLQPRLSVGFAELQVGEDTGGFDFAGTGPTGVATAGPEVGASLRALLPLTGGVELLGELSVGTAYFHHAPQLVRPQSAWQPSALLTLGIGF